MAITDIVIADSDVMKTGMFVWDTNALSWIRATGGTSSGSNVTVTNFPSTQAISAASLPLPSGAATTAKQPSLGTPGVPSSDVITTQGYRHYELATFTGPGQEYIFDCSSHAVVRLFANDLATGEMTVEGSMDGTTNWQDLVGVSEIFGGQNVFGLSPSEPVGLFPVGPYAKIRITSATSDNPVTVEISGSPFPNVIMGSMLSIPVVGTVKIRTTDEAAINIGQQAMAASVPVVVASNQSAIPISDGGSSVTVDGTITVNPLTNSSIVKAQLQDNAGNALNSTSNALNVNVQNASLPVTQSGNWTVRNQDGSGNSLTSTGNALDINLKTSSITLNTSITNSSGGSAVNIQDGGNSITVDGTVTASITASASTIAKAEDSASADADVGIPAMAIQKATPANTAGTDGDYEMLQMSVGRLWTSTKIDTAIPAGTNAIGKLAANDGVDVGDVTINNASGASAVNIQDGGNSITVDGGVTVTNATAANLKAEVVGTGTFAVQATIAASATNIAKAEDVAANDADVGVPAMAVRKATPANTSGTDGDYEMLQMSVGRLWVSATVDTALPAGSNTIGALTANQSVNNAQVNGSSMVTSVTGVQDVMPRKRTSSTGLSPNYSASRITSKTTTTITASTAYVSAITIACSAAGTTWTMVIQNKEGTPKILVPSFTLTVPSTGLPVILQFAEPILMTSGIDIVTGGTTAGTVDVYMTYWQ